MSDEDQRNKILDKNMKIRCIYGREVTEECPVRTAFPQLDPETLVGYCQECPTIGIHRVFLYENLVKQKARKKKKKKLQLKKGAEQETKTRTEAT